MNFYKRHLGDLAKSCSHLSQGAMGAYDLLIDWIYANERPLPNDMGDVYRIGRASAKVERDNVDKVLAEFFNKTQDGFTQKRITEELSKYAEKCAANKEIGKLGGRPKKTETVSETVSETDTRNNPSQNPESTITSTNVDVPADQSANPAPSCPQKSIVALYHEMLPELRQVRQWDGNRSSMLAKRWREDKERQSIDWWKGYFNYVKQSDFLMGRKPGSNGRGFDCDLEWLVRPTNFLKVIEGKYE